MGLQLEIQLDCDDGDDVGCVGEEAGCHEEEAKGLVPGFYVTL